MLMLVDCSNCRTPLQLPAGARSIRCAVCQAITRVADPRSLPPPLPPQQPQATSSNHYYHAPPQPPQPSPYNHLTSFGQTPSVNGKKRAVICGISYKRTKHELKGCINDAKCMKYLLINKFKFPESSILMLTGNVLIFHRFYNFHHLISYFIIILNIYNLIKYFN